MAESGNKQSSSLKRSCYVNQADARHAPGSPAKNIQSPQAATPNPWEHHLRYANQELPQAGDRIRNDKGGFGTVTRTSPIREQKPEPFWITVKWDEGIVDIEYDLASAFTLISRAAEDSSVDLRVSKSE